MSAMTDYLENELLDHVLGTGSWTMPTQVYLALHTGDPGEAGSANEVAAGNYARVAVDFAAASGGAANPTADVTFAEASGANWGTITHVSLKDASTAGNSLLKGALTSSKAIDVGDTFVIPLADLDIAFQ